MVRHGAMPTPVSPVTIFMLSFLAASVGAIGSIVKIRRAKGQKPTVGDILEAVFYHGSAGTAFAMCGFEYLGGIKKPWIIIGSAWGVGLGFIKIKEIPTYMRKFLNVIETKNEPTPPEPESKP